MDMNKFSTMPSSGLLQDFLQLRCPGCKGLLHSLTYGELLFGNHCVNGRKRRPGGQGKQYWGGGGGSAFISNQDNHLLESQTLDSRLCGWAG